MTNYPKKQIAVGFIEHGRKDVSEFMQSCDLIPKNGYITMKEEIKMTFTALKEIDRSKLEENLRKAYESIGHYVSEVCIYRIEDDE